MRKIVIAVTVLACWGAWQHYRHREITHAPGNLVSTLPVQSAPRDAIAFTHSKHQLTRLQEFQISARVLSRADYSMDRGAALAPMDLALGWGRMSDSAVLSQLSIRQAGRYFIWSAEQYPIPLEEIRQSASNMHLIPANEQVARTIDKTRVGDIVEFSGALVEAKGSDGWSWRSSLSRTDSGDGACELVYVEHYSIRP